MLYKFCCIFLLASLFSNSLCYSEEIYFKAVPERYMVTDMRSLQFNLLYKIIGANNTDFKVRPVIDFGSAYIYSKDRNEWISTNDTWLNMPSLDSNVSVKVISTGISKIELNFLIQHLTTSTIYKTPAVSLWTSAAFGNYLSKLSTNLRYQNTVLVE